MRLVLLAVLLLGSPGCVALLAPCHSYTLRSRRAVHASMNEIGSLRTGPTPDSLEGCSLILDPEPRLTLRFSFADGGSRDMVCTPTSSSWQPSRGPLEDGFACLVADPVAAPRLGRPVRELRNGKPTGDPRPLTERLRGSSLIVRFSPEPLRLSVSYPPSVPEPKLGLPSDGLRLDFNPDDWDVDSLGRPPPPEEVRASSVEGWSLHEASLVVQFLFPTQNGVWHRSANLIVLPYGKRWARDLGRPEPRQKMLLVAPGSRLSPDGPVPMRTPVLKARDPSPVSLTPELRATHALLHVFHDRLGTPRLRVLPAKGYTRERLPVFQLASLFPEPDSPSVRTLKLGLLEFGKGLSYVFTVPLDITPAGWLAYPLVEPIAYLLSRAIR